MTHLGLSDSVLTTVAITARNVANTGANSNVIDMSGWMGARFVLSVGVLGTNGTMDMAVYRDDNSGFNSGVLCTDANSNANAAVAQVVNSNSLQIIDVFRPRERYLRVVVTGQTNGSLGACIVDRYRAQGTLPPTQVAEQYVKIRES